MVQIPAASVVRCGSRMATNRNRSSVTAVI
jgi:hypothetical protein